MDNFQIFTSEGRLITNSLEFKPTSIDMFSSNKLIIISDSNIPISANIDSSDFSFFNIIGEDITFTHNIDNVSWYQTQDIENITKYVYELDIAFNPLTEKLGKSTLFINSRKIELIGSIDKVNDNLIVLLQNFKKYIDSDYVTAFRESVYNSPNDYELYNRKIREYLLNIHNLSTINGTYKSLSTAINYFGYKDLLTLREYWFSEDKYKSTPIGDRILTYIDKSLEGYKKSNQLSLVYQINQQSGIDSDGLPIYSNVFALTDEILLKMWALQRVLERDFLSINTHIVDIIGEYQSVVGVELSKTLHDAQINTYNITDNLNKSIKYTLLSNDIKILHHKVILDEFALKVDNNELKFIDNSISSFDKDYFTIRRLANEFDEYDMLTKYYSGEFGLVTIELDLDLSRYQFIRYELFKDEVSVFKSEVIEIQNILQFGIKIEGEYSVNVQVYDYYGSSTTISEMLKVSYNEPNVQIGIITPLDYLTKDSINLIEAYSTFESSEGINIPDGNNNLNINTWDQINNNPQMLIARKYATLYDQYINKTTPNQLSTIITGDLDNILTETWNTNHTVILIKPLSNSSIDINGETITFSNSITASGLHSTINNLYLTESKLTEDFDIDFIYYNDDPEGSVSDSELVLRLISIETGYQSEFVEITNSTVDYWYCYDTDIYASKMSELNIMATGTGLLEIKLDNNLVYSENVTLGNNTFNLFNSLPYFETFSVKNIVKIFSNFDVEIKFRDNFIYKSHVKARHLGKISILPNLGDIRVGQPIFASLFETYDIKDIYWTLTHSLTNKELSKQNSLAFRWLFKDIGIYNLNCEFKFKGKEYNFDFNGIFNVKSA